jgi:hypothetical protein
MRRVHLALGFAFAFAIGGIANQEAVVDEGTFVILHDGSPVGRENFKIVNAPSAGGQAFRATATIALNNERVTTTLTTDSLGAPLAYDVTVRVGAVLETTLRGSGRPGRFSALSRTRRGTAARDYIVGDNPLVLDAGVFHEYYFSTLIPRRSRYAVLEPRTEKQSVMRFEERGDESRHVGRRTVMAHHLALIAPDGSSRDVWVDFTGHLLRVEIPAAGLVAQRDELTR